MECVEDSVSAKITREQAVVEAARCLMCHDAPCEQACPARVGVTTFLRRIRFGDFGAALRKITETNVFAGTCGMACPQGMLCEEACVLRPTGRPIAIRDLQLSAHLYGREELPGLGPNPGAARVAVVGGGPAGLACAYYLKSLGIGVTVFEKAKVLGGMLTRGIPRYRIARDVVDREIALAARGTETVAGARAQELTHAWLKSQGFSAVLLAAGLWESGPPELQGSSLEGVIDGTGLLADLAQGDRRYLALRGKVAVIGGGNTACDVAVYLKRFTDCGVTVFYRRTREEMPAFPHEIDDALIEGVRFEFLCAPVAVKGRQRVESLVVRRQQLGEPDTSGRRRPVPIKGSDFTAPCDSVVFATGGVLDRRWLSEAFGVALSESGRIAISPETLATNVEGVFAAGDLIREKGLVVEAVADGRRAAYAIAKYLGGQTS